MINLKIHPIGGGGRRGLMDRALSWRPGGPRFESRRLLSSFLLGTYGSVGSGKDRTKSEEENQLGSNTKTEVELGDLVHIYKCIAVTLLIAGAG